MAPNTSIYLIDNYSEQYCTALPGNWQQSSVESKPEPRQLSVPQTSLPAQSLLESQSPSPTPQWPTQQESPPSHMAETIMPGNKAVR
jgi:hypothetical protein